MYSTNSKYTHFLLKHFILESRTVNSMPWVTKDCLKKTPTLDYTNLGESVYLPQGINSARLEQTELNP